MVTQVAATRVTALATYDTHTQGRCMYHATCSHAPPSVQASHTERNFGADGIPGSTDSGSRKDASKTARHGASVLFPNKLAL
jgi:hypothetical protein